MQAVTGSGKTLAFVVPVIERLLTLSVPLLPSHVGALLISPTRCVGGCTRRRGVAIGCLIGVCCAPFRELAQQTFRIVKAFVDAACESVPGVLSAVLMVGGTDVAADISACATSGCNVVVATPGRLLDMMTRLKDATDHAVTFKVGRLLCSCRCCACCAGGSSLGLVPRRRSWRCWSSTKRILCWTWASPGRYQRY